MKRCGIRAVALLISSALWFAAVHAAESGKVTLKEEVSKQEEIYRSLKSVEGYTVDRSLVIDTQGLPSEFGPALASLGPTDRWLDIGAGEGRAIRRVLLACERDVDRRRRLCERLREARRHRTRDRDHGKRW